MFLVGNLQEELEECNEMVEQRAEIMAWNVANNVRPDPTIHCGLQSQKRQLISWQEELLLTEAFLTSIIRQ